MLKFRPVYLQVVGYNIEINLNANKIKQFGFTCYIKLLLQAYQTSWCICNFRENGKIAWRSLTYNSTLGLVVVVDKNTDRQLSTIVTCTFRKRNTISSSMYRRSSSNPLLAEDGHISRRHPRYSVPRHPDPNR